MKKISKKHNIEIQEVQQRFVLEDFSRKISASHHRDNIIFKGGFVVSTILGFDTRMTRDIDVTYSSFIYSKEQVLEMIEDIIKSDFSSIFDYSIENIKESQSSDQFPGYTVTLLAQLRESKYTIKLDISNNTLIFPEAIMSNLKSLFGDDKIDLFTYQVENIIAEKFETTLDRGEFNGRIRDLFDVYLLFTVYTELIDYELLKKSILKVSEDRGTLNNLDDYHDLVSELLDSTIFNKNFSTYKDLQYSSYNTTINDVFDVFNKIYEIAIS